VKIGSHNEWDTLREVVVGNAKDAVACLTIPDSEGVSEEVLAKARQLAKDAYPQSMLDEVDEDMTDLCRKIEDFGAKLSGPCRRSDRIMGWMAPYRHLRHFYDGFFMANAAPIAVPAPTPAATPGP
jgi:hypothetical protein